MMGWRNVDVFYGQSYLVAVTCRSRDVFRLSSAGAPSSRQHEVRSSYIYFEEHLVHQHHTTRSRIPWQLIRAIKYIQRPMVRVPTTQSECERCVGGPGACVGVKKYKGEQLQQGKNRSSPRRRIRNAKNLKKRENNWMYTLWANSFIEQHVCLLVLWQIKCENQGGGRGSEYLRPPVLGQLLLHCYRRNTTILHSKRWTRYLTYYKYE